MIDPESAAYQAWYQAQLALARKCEAWRKEIADLELTRDQVATSAYAEMISDWSKQQLKDRLMLGGRDAKQMARAGNREQMRDFLLDDQREAIRRRIIALQKQIEQNQSSPLWREMKEQPKAGEGDYTR